MIEQFTLQDLVNMDTQAYRALQERLSLERWVGNYGYPGPMQKWFNEGISKLRGDRWENEYVSTCKHLGPKLNGDHDATIDIAEVIRNCLRGARAEIKFFTAMFPDSDKEIIKRGYALSWAERSQSIVAINNTYKRPKGGSFQQVKPTCADYGLFSAIFNNGAMHYWVPYHLISRNPKVANAQPGEIPLSGQHRDHKVEGQINMSDRFHELFFLDVTLGTPFITDFSKYDLSKYENIKY